MGFIGAGAAVTPDDSTDRRRDKSNILAPPGDGECIHLVNLLVTEGSSNMFANIFEFSFLSRIIVLPYIHHNSYMPFTQYNNALEMMNYYNITSQQIAFLVSQSFIIMLLV